MKVTFMRSRESPAGKASNRVVEMKNSLNEILQAIGDRDLVSLEQIGPDTVNLRDPEGRTPLMNAILEETPDPAVVKCLISRGADVNIHDDDQQWTALHFAARDQKEFLVRILLQAGALVDPVDVFGNTPLWRSVMNATEDLGAIRELAAHGADPNKKNKHGISPLDLARETARMDIEAVLAGSGG